MKYIIKYNYNGQEYENEYITIAPNLSIEEIAYEALSGSLQWNNICATNGCFRNIELTNDKNDVIYSAITYTVGMGFITNE